MMAVVNRIAVNTKMSSHVLFMGFTAIPRCRFCSTFHPDCKCVFGVCLVIMCKKNRPVEEVNQDIEAFAEMPSSEISSRNTQTTCTDRNTMESINQSK